MRTARVIQTSDSIFRNSRQYLHSNEQVFRIMQEGELNQFADGQRSRKRKRRREKSKLNRNIVLNTNSRSLTILGLRNDAVSIASLRNHLKKYSEKIEAARNQVTCLRAYRSSV